jgi:hypothetical protein
VPTFDEGNSSGLALFMQVAEIAINREIGGQIPCGCQSIPKARRPSPEGRLLDSLSSLEPTKPANRTAGVPLVNWGVIDPLQISDMRCGPPTLCQQAVHDNTARNWASLAKSRMEIEILIFDFGKCSGILFIVRLNLVQQRGKPRPRSWIACNSTPCHVAIQLGQKSWQILDQFLTFNRRKHPNRSFDFAGGTHLQKVTQANGQSNKTINFARKQGPWQVSSIIHQLVPRQFDEIIWRAQPNG